VRFSPIFCEKIGAFLKSQCYDPLLAEFSSDLRQNAILFANFFAENIFKIITSVPDRQTEKNHKLGNKHNPALFSIFSIRQSNSKRNRNKKKLIVNATVAEADLVGQKHTDEFHGKNKKTRQK
jgi:CHAT domain-containing protein